MRMRFSSYYPNRTLCAVLDEMRKAHETRNYSYLMGLIEEAQSMGNRMEAALSDIKDIKQMQEDRSKLKAELRELEQKVNDLKPKEDSKD